MRLPVVPWFFLFAAVAIAAFWDRWKRRADLPATLRLTSWGDVSRLAIAVVVGILVSVPRVYSIDERAAKSGFLLNRGTLLIEDNRCEEAILAFTAAAESDPGMVAAHYQLARAHERCERWKDAGDAYLEVNRRFPDFPYGYLGRARVSLALGDTLGADRAYREAETAAPEFAEAPFNYGTFLLSRGRFDEAAAAYRRGLTLEPSRLRSWMNYGYTLMRLDRTEEAIAAWEAALRLDPGNQMAINNIAAARRRRQP